MRDFSLLEVLPKTILEEQNKELKGIPTIKEVKMAVMGLNRYSIGGPDGMTGGFYQDVWQIIANNLHQMVTTFSMGMRYLDSSHILTWC